MLFTDIKYEVTVDLQTLYKTCTNLSHKKILQERKDGHKSLLLVKSYWKLIASGRGSISFFKGLVS